MLAWIAAFSRDTPWATDCPNVEKGAPSCGVTGQNISGVNTPMGTAPGKRRWIYEASTPST